jgi:PAS domain S-box-containing protein
MTPMGWIRILLAEDNPDDALMVEREIRRGGFNPYVVRVTTAKEALARLQEEEWDLVISDHDLPGSSGDEVLATLRETGLDIPFILASGTVGEDVAVAAMRAGANDYVLKDKLSRLAPAIERELLAAKSRAAQRNAEQRAKDADARLLAETTARARRLEVLHEMAAAASGMLDEGLLANLTVDRAKELLEADSSTLRWLDPATGHLLRLASNDVLSGLRPAVTSPSQSVMGRAFALDEPQIENHYQSASGNVLGREDGIRTMVAVPVRSGDRAIGALAVLRYDDRGFGEEDARFLTLLASLVGPAIEAARLHNRLAASEKRFRGIYEALACGVVVGRRDGTVIDVNRAARRLFGEQASGQLLATNSMGALYTDAAGRALDRAETPWGKAYLKGNRHQLETIGIQIPGREPIWAFTESVPSAGGDGIDLVVTSFIDVTPVKLAERALAESEALFKSAFEDAPVGVALTSVDGRFVRTNQLLADMLGYSLEELLRLSYIDVTHPDDAELGTSLRRRLAQPGASDQASSPTVLRFLRRDGEPIWVSLNVAAVRDGAGGIRNYVSQIADITEQRLAEQQLETTRGQLEQAQEIGSIGTWIQWLKAGEERTVWSAGEFKILGIEPGPLEPSTDAFLRLVHPEDRASVDERLAGAVRGEPYDSHHRIIRADGQVRWLHTRAVVVRDEHGAPSQLLGVTQDVTEQQSAEEAAKKSAKMLSSVLNNAPVILFAIDREGMATVAEGKALTALGLTPETAKAINVFETFKAIPEATAHIEAGLAGASFAGEVNLTALDLWFDARYEPLLDAEGNVVGLSGLATDITDRVRANRTREESEAKSRVVAMMNHEVRTPLNSILGFAELLKAGGAGTLNAKQQRYVANVDSAGRHLLSLVNDSLDLSKLAANQMDFSLGPLELEPILAQAANQVQPLAEARGLELVIEPSDGVWVRADHRGLLQVLYNLLSNAFKHSPAGNAVTIRTAVKGESVRISVEDHGSGIPHEALERIFLEFVTLNSQVEGTGLGLALSRKLAQMMGGDISVTSEVGAGSTFTMTLAAAPAEKVEKAVRR